MKFRISFLMLSCICTNTFINKNNVQVALSSSTRYEHTVTLDSVTTKTGIEVDVFDAAGAIGMLIYDYNSSIPNEYQESINFFKSTMYNYHKLFDRHYDYKDQSGADIINLKKINESYGTNQKLEIDKALYDVLSLGLDLTVETKGKFNIGIGMLADLWSSFITPQEFLWMLGINLYEPSSTQIEAAKNCVPSYQEIKDILVLEENNDHYYVTFNKYQKCNSQVVYDDVDGQTIKIDSVQITLGAIGKGYTTEVIKNKINDLGKIENFYISSGTSSIAGNGTFLDGKKIRLGIANADFVGTQTIATLELEKITSVSTSGDYLRCFAYYDENDEFIIRHHIIDPDTGYPQNYHRIITIFGDNAGVLDAVSTALFNLELMDGYKLLRQLEAKYGKLDAVWQTEFIEDYYDITGTVNIYVTDRLFYDFIIEDKNMVRKVYVIENGKVKDFPSNFNLFKHIKDNFWNIYFPISLFVIVVGAGIIQAYLKIKKEKKENGVKPKED